MAITLTKLKTLRTPQAVQDFLDTLAMNHEKQGETCMSPAQVLKTRKAHCLEAALLASLALSYQGHPMRLLNLHVGRGDDDHAVALYRINGYWGAISKTNHVSLRFRDPIYRTLRELALSYFHEYYLNDTGRKTLQSYSTRPFSLSKFGTSWIASDDNLWDIAYALKDAPHTSIVPKENKRFIRNADHMERKAGELVEWPYSHPRT